VLACGRQSFSGDDPDTGGPERFDPLYCDSSPSAWATGSGSAMLFINSNVQSHDPSLRLSPTRRDTGTPRYARVRAEEERSPAQFGQATRPEFDAGDLSAVVSGVADAHLSDDLFVGCSRIVDRDTCFTAGVGASSPGRGIRRVAPDDTPARGGGRLREPCGGELPTGRRAARPASRCPCEKEPDRCTFRERLSPPSSSWRFRPPTPWRRRRTTRPSMTP
jgi:hypothetical protein